MDAIAPSSNPVIFGDGSYWLSRRVVSDDTYVQVVREAAGLAENGQVGLRLFCRAGGELLYTDSGSPAPFGLLQMHS
jgi:hypothetical protein